MPAESRLRPPPAVPAPADLAWAERLHGWPQKITDRWLRLWLPRRFPGLSLAPSARVEWPSYWRIHPDARVTIGPGVWIRHHAELLVEGGRLSVGAGTYIGPYAVLNGHESLSIGRDCLIAEMVAIRDVDHAYADPGLPVAAQGYTVAPTRIGDGVWVGAKSSLLKGVTLGDGCIVGANSVVTRDVPAGAIAVGAPARIVGWRHG
jgi:acetyltransferase-like isoleucine patch superfamily enzyme